MTRQLFEATFLEHYERYIRWGVRKLGTEGPDIVHQCYANILEHGTFRGAPSKYAARWISWKLAREMVRHRKATKVRHQKTWEAREVIIGALQERETLERPDIALIAKELEPKEERCK